MFADCHLRRLNDSWVLILGISTQGLRIDEQTRLKEILISSRDQATDKRGAGKRR